MTLLSWLFSWWMLWPKRQHYAMPHPHFISKPDVMGWIKRDYLRCLSTVRLLIDECVRLGSLRIKLRWSLKYFIKLAHNMNASGRAGVLPAVMSTNLFSKQSFLSFETLLKNLLLCRRRLREVGPLDTYYSFFLGFINKSSKIFKCNC